MNPARLTLSNGTLVIPQGLARREEPSTLCAQELAHLPMLRDLMTKAIMLPREAFRTAEGTRERCPRFRLVGLCVNLQRVLTGETPRTPWNLTRESAFRITVAGRRGRLSRFERMRRGWMPRRAGRRTVRITSPCYRCKDWRWERFWHGVTMSSRYSEIRIKDVGEFV